MDEVSEIRHRVLVKGESRRKVAEDLGVSRNTVKRYVEDAAVGVRKPSTRATPALDRARERMDALLADSGKWTAGKQRLTATQLHRLLRREGIAVGVSLVKEYVREWKRQRAEVFVPLIYKPGDLALVDFFEVWVDVGDVRRKAFLFVMRLMASGRDFAWLFPRQDQVCFLEGHVRAFRFFGGVPHRIGYDNLKAAVAKILAGSERALTARFAALVNHHLFEPCFARPATGHDKGGVEARGKGIRLQHFVPIPTGASLSEISEALSSRMDEDARTQRDREGRTVADRFSEERARLLPLPPADFRAAATRHVTATRRALVQVEGGYYSVWSEWAGLSVTAYVGVDSVEITGPDVRTVVHPRRSFGKRSIDYRHYLPELTRKPQAVRQVIDELAPTLGDTYVRAWRQLVDANGPKQAARVFAQLLGAIQTEGVDSTARLVESALLTGEPLQLALRPKSTTPALPSESLPESVRDVVVESASAADFDALLRGVA